MQFKKGPSIVGGGIVAAVIVTGAYMFGAGDTAAKADNQAATVAGTAASLPAGNGVGDPLATDNVLLNELQIKSIEIGAVGEHVFSQQRTAVGSIDFNENLAVQVFPPYQGKIIKAYAEIGQQISKGATLYTIDSPDLVQAESTMIAAAGVAKLTGDALVRGKQLFAIQGLAQKDLDQTVSDQQAAEAALKAARDAVRLFGKSDSEIDAIIAKRQIDPVLVVSSPITGRVTARTAQPGLLVQPGNSPAPYAVADLSTMWMVANVAESDSPAFHTGQSLRVKVMAFPERDFAANIAVIGATVDPTTHTVLVRSEIGDPQHELRPGMFATYVIRTGDPLTSLAVALDGVAREGDGTMSVWVTKDRRHFSRRTVKLGLQQDGFDQIIEGLQAGELVVSKGAVFLSNMANGDAES